MTLGRVGSTAEPIFHWVGPDLREHFGVGELVSVTQDADATEVRGDHGQRAITGGEAWFQVTVGYPLCEVREAREGCAVDVASGGRSTTYRTVQLDGQTLTPGLPVDLGTRGIATLVEATTAGTYGLCHDGRDEERSIAITLLDNMFY